MTTPPTLTHYLTAWNLTDPQPVVQTPTSYVYTVESDGERVVLKLLTPLGVKDERAGAVALRRFDGQGAVRLLREDEGAHLLEYADGEDLIPMVGRGEDEAAARIIAGVLNRLHGAYTGEPPDGLIPLRRWFRSLFRKAAHDREAGQSSIFMRAAPIAESLLNDQRDLRVLHGDIHHANVRHHAKRGPLAFDPKGLYGERAFDAANTLCNPVAMPELVTDTARLLRIAGIMSEGLKIELSWLLQWAYVYACLSACWSLEDGGDANTALRVAAILERLIG